MKQRRLTPSDVRNGRGSVVVSIFLLYLPIVDTG